MRKVNIAFVLIIIGFSYSCKSKISLNQNVALSQIEISKTECGSYQIKNNQKLIGYAVKPFILKVNRKKEISEFEDLLKIKHKNNFKNDYRIYSFTKNWVGDTILNTYFFNERLIKDNPNWKCEEQDIDTYWPKKNTLFGEKHVKWLSYNCSRNRLKVAGDPD